MLSRTLAVLWSLSEAAIAEGHNDSSRPAGATSAAAEARAIGERADSRVTLVPTIEFSETAANAAARVRLLRL